MRVEQRLAGSLGCIDSRRCTDRSTTIRPWTSRSASRKAIWRHVSRVRAEGDQRACPGRAHGAGARTRINRPGLRRPGVRHGHGAECPRASDESSLRHGFLAFRARSRRDRLVALYRPVGLSSQPGWRGPPDPEPAHGCRDCEVGSGPSRAAYRRVRREVMSGGRCNARPSWRRHTADSRPRPRFPADMTDGELDTSVAAVTNALPDEEALRPAEQAQAAEARVLAGEELLDRRREPRGILR